MSQAVVATGACEGPGAHRPGGVVRGEPAGDGGVEGSPDQLVQIEGRLGGKRLPGPASIDRETAVEPRQLVGVELAELEVAEVGEQVVLD